ncbi:hypothetical protein [Nocardia aurantia]|uniref:DUF8020 domain-containing protein n=1 Tax=Nocardia aurantia TaxID=2585199 RepID=A0A7K0DRS8_9NOCA|nr:hypothetical protein [Nocardia aurantia]MQY28441.1 hypothetical protein [Nocardia aurantia]
MRKFTAYAVLMAGALIVASGTSNAGPADPDHRAVELNGIHFTVDRQGDAVVLASPDGLFETVGDSVVIRDPAGNFNDSLPLSYRRDDQVYPIAAEIGDHSVRFTPASTGGHTVADPITPADIARGQELGSATAVAESFTPRDQTALGMFASRVGIGSVVGAVIGAIVGAGLGCVAGAAVGSVSVAVATLLGGVLPGAVVGCVAGVATVGTVGTLAGSALVAGPILLWSAYQYFSTILAPCAAPGTYCVDPAAPAGAK